MTTGEPALSRERIPEIQSLRALAIGLVLAYHYMAGWTFPIEGVPAYSDAFAGSWAQHGWIGVQLFFMVSGFVIAMTLQSTSGIREFAIKRFVRLWPALLIALPLVFAVTTAIGPSTHKRTLVDLLASFSLVHPHWWSTIGILNGDWVTAVLWTLWVEIQFYAVAAFAYYVLGRHRFPVTMLFAGLILTALYSPRFGYVAPELALHYWWFFAGVLFHLVWTSPRRSPRALAAWSGIGLTAGLNIRDLILLGNREPVVLTVLFFALFTLIVVRRRVGWLRLPAVVFLGEISYELYLVHDALGVSLLYRFDQLMGGSTAAYSFALVVATAVSLVAAWALWRFWSRPAQRRLTRRLLRRPHPVVLSAAQ